MQDTIFRCISVVPKMNKKSDETTQSARLQNDGPEDRKEETPSHPYAISCLVVRHKTAKHKGSAL